MFDVDPLPYDERRIATGLRGADGARRASCTRCTSTPSRRCWSTSSMYYKLGRAGRALDRFGVIEFATTIAPGVRDVLLTGKVYEAVQRNSAQQGRHRSTTPSCSTRRRPAGSPSSSTSTTSWPGWPRSGPIKSQADTVMTLFRSPRTAVHLVTVLEEMPVQETADGIADLRDARPARSAAWWSTWSARATSTPTTSRPRATGELDTRRDRRRPEERPGVDVDDDAGRRAARRGPRPRRAAGPGGRAARAGRRPRRADVRAAPAGRRRRPRRPLRARRRLLRDQGMA